MQFLTPTAGHEISIDEKFILRRGCERLIFVRYNILIRKHGNVRLVLKNHDLESKHMVERPFRRSEVINSVQRMGYGPLFLSVRVIDGVHFAPHLSNLADVFVVWVEGGCFSVKGPYLRHDFMDTAHT